MLLPNDPLTYVVVAGVCVHLVFRRFEPWTPWIHLLLLLIVPSGVSYAAQLNPLLSLSLFWATLALSIVIYRISPLHPLASFPGPLLEKVTMFRMAFISARGKRHHYIRDLHERYGAIVRIGPNALSVVDREAVAPIYGAGASVGAAWQRSVNYDSGKNKKVGSHVLNERDAVRHLERRRVWSRAFSPQALRAYEADVVRRAGMLADGLEAQAGVADGHLVPAAIDISKWISCFSFDVMGDLAFGGGFNTLLDGDSKGFIRILAKGVRFGTITGNLPWLTPYLALRPAPDDFQKMFRFAKQRLDWRRSQPQGERRDIFHYLSGEDGNAAPPEPELLADSALLLVAGADTTASALTALLYHVLKHRAVYQRLQTELGALPRAESGRDARLPFLDAVITETLRIAPPVPSGGRRSPPDGSGGQIICGRFVPEGTAVTVHPFAMQRRSDYFHAPEAFMPDRWLTMDKSRREMADACIPFLAGNTSCIGKQLAMQELRIAVCTLFRRFEMQLAPESEAWYETVEDFTMTRGDALKVYLSPRVPVRVDAGDKEDV
ncbi:cytochrome P450 [Auricularia subglabra TFB-10046 SS5]|nr:cytochrome P450 [Auricularia subglabra TFB-10046 SS5]